MKYILLCLILVSCGQRDKYREDYGVLEDTQLSVSSQHMGGFGRSQCLLCHNAQLNIHKSSGGKYFTADELKTDGEKVCLGCHSGNGLPE